MWHLGAANRLCHEREQGKNYSSHLSRLRNIRGFVDPSEIKRHRSNFFQFKNHLANKSKKHGNIIERNNQIQCQNRILLRKILKIDLHPGKLSSSNLFQRNTPSYGTLNRSKRIQELIKITQENKALLNRLQVTDSVYNIGAYEKEYNKSQYYSSNISKNADRFAKMRSSRGFSVTGDYRPSTASSNYLLNSSYYKPNNENQYGGSQKNLRFAEQNRPQTAPKLSSSAFILRSSKKQDKKKGLQNLQFTQQNKSSQQALRENMHPLNNTNPSYDLSKEDLNSQDLLELKDKEYENDSKAQKKQGRNTEALGFSNKLPIKKKRKKDKRSQSSQLGLLYEQHINNYHKHENEDVEKQQRLNKSMKSGTAKLRRKPYPVVAQNLQRAKHPPPDRRANPNVRVNAAKHPIQFHKSFRDEKENYGNHNRSVDV